MSNSLDPDQARQLVGPDLRPNCFQRLSADDTCRQRILYVSKAITTCNVIKILSSLFCINKYFNTILSIMTIHFFYFTEKLMSASCCAEMPYVYMMLILLYSFGNVAW